MRAESARPAPNKLDQRPLYIGLSLSFQELGNQAFSFQDCPFHHSQENSFSDFSGFLGLCFQAYKFKFSVLGLVLLLFMVLNQEIYVYGKVQLNIMLEVLTD